MKLFLAGDVMTGRGIDQVLSHPGKPPIFEPVMHDARGYVELAEEVNGPIPRHVAPEYVWGDLLAELERAAPDLRIANLETSITTSEDRTPKGINYRMHPDNVSVIGAAGLDACVLANNHVLDYGEAGLVETLETLAAARVRVVGAGRDRAAAQAPLALPVASGGRVLVVAAGHPTSGCAPYSAATDEKPGIDLLPDLSDGTADAILARVERARLPGDVVLASLHWGSNWGYALPAEQIHFAHRLVQGGVDLVHGHSSHHPRPIEVYRGRLVLYGCGDLLNDYEGIGGIEEPFRGDLALAYLVTLAPDGALETLEALPLRLKKFRLHRASSEDARWLRDTLAAASGAFGTTIELARDGRLVVRGRGWRAATSA